MVELDPGTVLLDKYRVDEVLGIGGMGRVVRASHLYLQQPVAIKILLQSLVDSESTRERFLREAQAMVSLRSEHIVRVMDVGTLPDDSPFMVMEYLEGNDLNQILRHHGPQAPAVVVDLMLQACEGIAEAHARGIVHRDIKPSNFFITRRPDGSMLLKILDFGISKTPVGLDDLTGTQTILGTPTYMAPEQMKSGKDSEPRSDIWSMGVVMYQMLEGRPPFVGDSYAELVLKVSGEPPTPMHNPLPAGLNQVIMRCLERNPNHRQQNVAELARMLAPFASDPATAGGCAARTMRILLASRRSQQSLPLGAGGGLAPAAPLSPAALTPRSWPPTGGSVSQGKGQLTYQVPSKRGWLIATVTTLCLAAGAGGFAASRMMKDTPKGDDAPTAATRPAPPVPTPAEAAAAAIVSPTSAAAPAPLVAAPIAPPVAASAPVVAAPIAAPVAASAPVVVAPPAPTPVDVPRPVVTPPPAPIVVTSPAPPKPAPPVAVTRPVVTPPATKPTPPRPVAKPVVAAKVTPPEAAAKPASKPRPHKPSHDDDLFDSRH